MRQPRPRFPFHISSFQGESPGSQPLPPDGESFPAGECLKQILQAVDELKPHIRTNTEKMSKVMTKIGLLESSLDEFLESAPPQGQDELGSFFEKFIPVLDNLNFLKRAVEDSGDDQWQKGMVIFYEKLFNLLRDFGIEPAAQKGMNFDPSRHESVDTAVNPGLPPGSVADIVLDGWTYRGRLLRFAKVIVVRNVTEE